MKTCDYCGHKNDDSAVRCSECGTEEFKELNKAALLETEPELVNLMTCQNLGEAQMAAARLQANGIEAFIPDEAIAGTIGLTVAFGFIRVQVAPKDFEAA